MHRVAYIADHGRGCRRGETGRRPADEHLIVSTFHLERSQLTRTDAEGRVTVRAMMPGSSVLAVEHQGIETPFSVTIAAGESRSVAVTVP